MCSVETAETRRHSSAYLCQVNYYRQGSQDPGQAFSKNLMGPGKKQQEEKQ